MSRDLLFELGVEEIPPAEAVLIGRSLQTLLPETLSGQRLSHGEISVLQTPRRIAFIVKNLAEQQEAITREVRGPAKRVAFDESGNPGPAAQGFAKSRGVAVEDLKIKVTADGEYLYAEERVAGLPTARVLPQLLTELIRSIPLTETMRWDDSGWRFIRPIRRLHCTFGTQAVELELAGLRSQARTTGHPAWGRQEIEVEGVPDYLDKLRAAGVILEPRERRQMVVTALDETAKRLGARPLAPDALIDEIVHNVEYPTAIAGRFPQEFLALPKEILETTLIEHQKFVPFAAGDVMVPHFVGFRDGPPDDDGVVRAGYERIVRARLYDARFFVERDRRRKLVDYTKDLRSVVFHEKLGTIWDKVERVRKMAVEIGRQLQFTHLSDTDRAAFLCKADLVTAVVGEFPSLEAIVGSIYAKLDGEPELVYRAIREHLLPKSAEDPVPESETGAAVSVADKLDTILGLLYLGEQPTGSRDPYALRRKANGIIKIALERDINLDFFQLIHGLDELYCFLEKRESMPVIEDFFLERLYQELLQDYGFAHDVLDALIAARDGNFYRVARKGRALERIRGEQSFKDLVVAFSRGRNITQNQKVEGFDPQLFKEEAERELWRGFLKAEGQIKKLLPKEDYDGIIERLLILKAPIDRYFDDVLVMCPDRALRQNRLGFLREIVKLFFTIGDLSKIVVEGASTTDAPHAHS